MFSKIKNRFFKSYEEFEIIECLKGFEIQFIDFFHFKFVTFI
jgi:hypothetical protein